MSEELEEGSQKNSPTSSFDPESWIFTKGMVPDREGYYCPTAPAFPSWSMWTKNKHRADAEISITFSLLDRTDNEKDPTFYLSYGDKTSDAPDAFYRLNIFDGDLNTLRLYDRDENEVLNERTVNSAPLDRFITFTLSPVFPKKTSSTLILNPLISYQTDGNPDGLNPKKEFKIDLPLPSGEDQGNGFQYGIGVSRGDCFKIISTNL